MKEIETARLSDRERIEKLKELLSDVTSQTDRLRDTANGISESVEGLVEVIEVGVQPELSVLLDTVSSYRQANLETKATKTLTPAFKRSGSVDKLFSIMP